MLIDDLSILKYTEELVSDIVLKKPSGEEVGFLTKTTGESLDVDLIGVNTFNFSIANGDSHVDDVKVGKFITLKIYQNKKVEDGLGNLYKPIFYEEDFYITEVSKIESDKNLIQVTTKSNYILLGQRIVQGYYGFKSLYRTESDISNFITDFNNSPNGMIKEGSTEFYSVEQYENSGLMNYIAKLSPDWTVNEEDIDFDLAGNRAELDIQESSVLDVLTSIVPETFGGIVQFDTLNKTISVIKPELIGTDEGLIIENEQIAKKIESKIDTSEWVTKLYPYGSEEMTIVKANPLGAEYIINLNYVKNSEFMSTDLISAINDYESYLEDNKADFQILLDGLSTLDSQLKTLIDERNALEQEIRDLRGDLDEKIIRYANTDDPIPSPTPTDLVNTINEKSRLLGDKFTEIKDLGYYVDGEWEPNTTGIAVLSEPYDGNLEVYLVGPNEYTYDTVEGIDYIFDGVDTVSDLDTDNYRKVILVYDAELPNSEITYKKKIELKEDQILDREIAIANVKDSFEIGNRFDAYFSGQPEKRDEVYSELQAFIREKVYRNDSIFEPSELYDKAIEVLDKINSPQLSVSIDASDFLNSLDYSTEWEKVKVGNTINVKSKMLPGGHVAMKIIGFKWSFNENKLSLKLSSSNRINEDTFELEDLLDKANNTSTKVTINDSKYGAYVDSGERNSLLDYINNKLDLAAQGAVAGRNQEITIDDGGILLANKVPDQRKIKLLNNMMVLTSDDFKTADVAITPDGIFAERLVGKIIIGTELFIQSSDEQTFTINEDGITINGGSLTINGGLPQANDLENEVDDLNFSLAELDTFTTSMVTDFMVDKTEAARLKELWISVREESNDIVRKAEEVETILSISLSELVSYNSELGYLETEINKYIGSDKTYPIFIETELERDAISNYLGRVQDAKTILINKINDLSIDIAFAPLEESYDNLDEELRRVTEDNVITLAESEELKLDWFGVSNDSVYLIDRANTLNIDSSNYSTALANLQTEVELYIDQPSYPIDVDLTVTPNIYTLFNTAEEEKSKLITALAEGYTNEKALIFDTDYNNFKFNKTLGFITTTASNSRRITIDGLDNGGIKIEGKDEFNQWESRFYADVSGNLILTGELITEGAGNQVVLSGENGIEIYKGASRVFYGDTNGNLTVKGTINAEQLIINGIDVLGASGELSQINSDLGDITGGSLDIGNGNFTVTSGGVMTATEGTFSGDITGSTITATVFSNTSGTGEFVADQVGVSNLADFKFFSGSITNPMFEIQDNISSTFLRRDNITYISLGEIVSDLRGSMWTYNGSEILTVGDTVTAVFG